MIIKNMWRKTVVRPFVASENRDWLLFNGARRKDACPSFESVDHWTSDLYYSNVYLQELSAEFPRGLLENAARGVVAWSANRL